MGRSMQFVFGLVLLLLIVVIFLFVENVPPESHTKTVMIAIMYQRIPAYIAVHHQLPNSLADLPIIPQHGEDVKDGWGRDIRFAKDSDGVMTLISFGSDGMPGGNGRDADIVRKFRFSADLIKQGKAGTPEVLP